VKPRYLIIAGALILGVGVLMGIVAASMFAMPTVPPRPIYFLGFICFWGFMPTGIIGCIVLAVGGMASHRSP
jgi:hypothetical protein